MGALKSIIMIAGIVALNSLGLTAEEPVRPFRAKDVFDYGKAIIFQDDFQTGQFRRWNFSEDDRYRLQKETPERIRIVDAPGLDAGQKAARFYVPREANSFRAEISLPHENGWQERWYGARVLIPHDWVFDSNSANDIVLQWHAIPGNGKATYPNLEISAGNTSWYIRQSYGSAQTKPTRTNHKLDDPIKAGEWVSWVIHAKWSPDANGILQIWKDGKLVKDCTGINVYSTIGVEYTPYLKTGIYHPEWHIDREARRQAFEKQQPLAKIRVVYVTDIKVGDAKAKYQDVAPTTKPAG